MPIYGYRCSNCGHQFEILQKMSDASLTSCPKCEGKLTKVIYPTGIIYKGSGYYTTDYKAGSKGAASTNGSPATPESKPSSALSVVTSVRMFRRVQPLVRITPNST